MSNENLRYKEYRQGRRFLVKIRPGESLQDGIDSLLAAEKIESAVVLSGIGSVRNVRLKDIKSGAKLPITPARDAAITISGPDTRNIGAAIAGSRRLRVMAGGRPWFGTIMLSQIISLA